jgi:DNA-binding CsgD family transcriptional regulator
MTRLLPTVALAFVLAVTAADVAADARAGATVGHLGAELAVIAVAAAALAALSARAVASRLEIHSLRRDLGATHALADRWRCEAERWRVEAQAALRGLGAAIDAQFERWQLTAAEKEVALLLMKGYSMKEVARARGTSERTVRAQSLAVYRKAGLEGRAELAAFFLEDLLLPRHPAPGTDSAPAG